MIDLRLRHFLKGSLAIVLGIGVYLTPVATYAVLCSKSPSFRAPQDTLSIPEHQSFQSAIARKQSYESYLRQTVPKDLKVEVLGERELPVDLDAVYPVVVLSLASSPRDLSTLTHIFKYVSNHSQERVPVVLTGSLYRHSLRAFDRRYRNKPIDTLREIAKKMADRVGIRF